MWHIRLKVGKILRPYKPSETPVCLTVSVSGMFPGTITPYKATLHLEEGTTPQLFMPRPVPFALHEQVGMELDQLEKLSVLEKIKFREWGAPIVVVPKKSYHQPF